MEADLITTTYDKPIPQVRGDTLGLYLPLVHVGADGSVGAAYTAQEAVGFAARWTIRKMQVRKKADGNSPSLLTVLTAGIQVMSDPAVVGLTPGLYITALAAQTSTLLGRLLFDVQLSDGTTVWTIVRGTLEFTPDVTDAPPS